jgi:hypothetical protein
MIEAIDESVANPVPSQRRENWLIETKAARSYKRCQECINIATN